MTIKKILITGHKGFIGKYLTKAVFEVFNGAGKEVAIAGLDLQNGIDQDLALVKLSPDYDLVFHLAAHTSVPESVQKPKHDARNNIITIVNLIQNCPKAKIIFTSSVAAEHLASPYGVAKHACELYLQNIHKNAVICRLPNVFASDDHGVVGRFIKEPEIEIYGNGEQTRDFVHVSDIVKGLIKAAEWDPGLYEFGSGKSVPIIDLANATGKKIKSKPARPGDVLISTSKNTTPDWKPEIDVVEFIKNKVGGK